MESTATAHSTTSAGHEADSEARETESEHWEQEPVMAAQRKACSSVLLETLITSSCRAAASVHLTGLGSSTETRAHRGLVVKLLPRQRK